MAERIIGGTTHWRGFHFQCQAERAQHALVLLGDFYANAGARQHCDFVSPKTYPDRYKVSTGRATPQRARLAHRMARAGWAGSGDGPRLQPGMTAQTLGLERPDHVCLLQR